MHFHFHIKSHCFFDCLTVSHCHTSVSRIYVPSSLLECRELSPVSELESVSPRGSDIVFRLEDFPDAWDNFGLTSGKSGSSGVVKIRSLSLKRTLFSLPQPPLPDECPDEEALPGLPVADIRETSVHPGC